MAMLQHYYTSTNKGSDGIVGFQCKAKSPGITAEESSGKPWLLVSAILVSSHVDTIPTRPGITLDIGCRSTLRSPRIDTGGAGLEVVVSFDPLIVVRFVRRAVLVPVAGQDEERIEVDVSFPLPHLWRFNTRVFRNYSTSAVQRR